MDKIKLFISFKNTWKLCYGTKTNRIHFIGFIFPFIYLYLTLPVYSDNLNDNLLYVQRILLNPKTKSLLLIKDYNYSTISSVPKAFLLNKGQTNLLPLDYSFYSPQSFNFSHNGKLIAGNNYLGAIKIWDSNTGKSIKTFAGYINEKNYTAEDSNYIVSVSGALVRINNIQTKGMVRQFYQNKDFFIGNKYFTALKNNKIIISEIISGKKYAEINYPLDESHHLVNILFSHDEKYICVISSNDMVSLFDINIGTKRFSYKTPANIEFAFSKNNRNLIIYDRNVLKIIETKTGKFIKKVVFKDSLGNNNMISRYGGLLAKSTDDYSTYNIISVSTGKILGKYKFDILFDFSPDERYMAVEVQSRSGEPSKTEIWDLKLHKKVTKRDSNFKYMLISGKFYNIHDGKLIEKLPSHDGLVETIAFSNDDKKIFSYGNDLITWDIASGNVLNSIINSRYDNNYGLKITEQRLLSYSDSFENEKPYQLILYNNRKKIRECNINLHTNAYVTDFREKTNILSEDEKYIFAVDHKNYSDTLIKYNTTSCKSIYHTIIDLSIPEMMSLSTNGKLLIVSNYDKINIYNAETGKLINKINTPGKQQIESVTLTPDNKKLIVSFSENNIIIVYDLKTSKEILSILINDNDWAAISSDGYYDGKQKLLKENYNLLNKPIAFNLLKNQKELVQNIIFAQ